MKFALGVRCHWQQNLQMPTSGRTREVAERKADILRMPLLGHYLAHRPKKELEGMDTVTLAHCTIRINMSIDVSLVAHAQISHVVISCRTSRIPLCVCSLAHPLKFMECYRESLWFCSVRPLKLILTLKWYTQRVQIHSYQRRHA